MSDVIGPRNIQQPSQQAPQGSTQGSDLQLKADQEIDRILSEQYDRGLKLLTENRDVLDAIARVLVQEEKINGKQLLQIIEQVKPELVTEGAIAAIEGVIQPNSLSPQAA